MEEADVEPATGGGEERGSRRQGQKVFKQTKGLPSSQLIGLAQAAAAFLISNFVCIQNGWIFLFARQIGPTTPATFSSQQQEKLINNAETTTSIALTSEVGFLFRGAWASFQPISRPIFRLLLPEPGTTLG